MKSMNSSNFVCFLSLLLSIAHVTTGFMPYHHHPVVRIVNRNNGLLTSSNTKQIKTRLYKSVDDKNEEASHFHDESSLVDNNQAVDNEQLAAAKRSNESSKRKMLSFAIPALGIYLSNPLLSNIDNSFVGKTVGTQGLAALSPATICTDQMLYLFSFLSRATTGLVARAYGNKGDKDAAREAGSAPLTVSLICGFGLSIFYAFFTKRLLALLNVNPALRGPAASYIYWRGAIAWAALAQSVSLSVMMATRDAITPLKIIALAAGVNVVGDALLCVWPLRWGCSGAAAATAFATLFSSAFMIKSLHKKQLLPKIRLPTKQEMKGLLEFTGPLLFITLTRLTGFISMQRTAMRLGVQQLAAYQLSINLVLFFLLFAEPLSQLSQTKLPSLIDSQEGGEIKDTLKSVLSLGAMAAVGIGGLAGLTLKFGSGLFSSDLAVQGLAGGAALSVFITVATSIFAVTVDGVMLAAKDFKFMLLQGLTTMILQLKLLKYVTSISGIYSTFTLRLGSYAAIALCRIALGRGAIGRALKLNTVDKTTTTAAAAATTTTLQANGINGNGIGVNGSNGINGNNNGNSKVNTGFDGLS